MFFFSNALHHQQQADYIPHEYSLSLSRWLLMVILNRELHINQLSGTIPSSIGSLVNLKFLYVNPTLTSTNALLLQCSSPPTTSRLHTSRILTLSLSMLVDDDIEQIPQRQSTERHHSIIDWVSQVSLSLVRQSNMNIHKCSSSSPMLFTTTNKQITYLTNTHSLSLSRWLLMMILNRYLDTNQLSGTTPSSIDSLENLYRL